MLIIADFVFEQDKRISQEFDSCLSAQYPVDVQQDLYPALHLGHAEDIVRVETGPEGGCSRYLHPLCSVPLKPSPQRSQS